MSESLLSRTKRCYICGAIDVEKHHIFFGTAKRRISDTEGCWLWLCPEHHRGSSGVHSDNNLSRRIQIKCEQEWIRRNKSDEEGFRRVFGRNYI